MLRFLSPPFHVPEPPSPMPFVRHGPQEWFVAPAIRNTGLPTPMPAVAGRGLGLILMPFQCRTYLGKRRVWMRRRGRYRYCGASMAKGRTQNDSDGRLPTSEYQ